MPVARGRGVSFQPVEGGQFFRPLLTFDAVEPINRDWETNTRLAAMGFWRQLRTLHDPEAVASLARDVLSTYRETAIAAGEPYYSRRYDKLLDGTQGGGHVRSSDRDTGRWRTPPPRPARSTSPKS